MGNKGNKQPKEGTGSELNLSLRINAEALSVVLADDSVVLSWPYHCILCWGYTANTFQFKVLSRPTVSTNAAGEQSRNLNERIMDPFVLLVDESIVHDRRMQPLTEAGLPSPTSTSSSPDMMAAAAVAAAAAAGSAAAGDGLVVSDTDGMPPEPSPFGMAPPFAASSSGARTEEDATDFHTFDSKDTPSSSAATAGVEVLNAHATPASRMASSGGAGGASSLEPAVQEGDDAGGASSSDDAIGSITSYVLLTEYGEQIEAAVMNSVQALMSKMDAHGVPDAEFRALLETLTRLTEDDMGDYALQVMRQMSLTRTFDVRQAREMVITIGSVSPFDQIEAAVLLYDKVMNKESYPLVLACFDDATDRANICHRLGITVDGKGCIVATRQKAAVKAT